MQTRHCLLLHPALSFSGSTERLLATARAVREQSARVTILSRPGSRSRVFTEEGFELREAELPTDPRVGFLAARRTRSIVARLQPDLLHATSISLARLTAALSRSLALPYLVEAHHPLRRPLPRHGRRLARVLTASESLVEGIVNRGRVPRSAVSVLPHSPSHTLLSAEDGAVEVNPFGQIRAPRIGCSGFLDGRHDTDWFLDAARILLRSGVEARFFVLGEGPHEERLRRTVRDWGLAESIAIGVPTTARASRSLASLDLHVACRTDGDPGWLACQALTLGIPSLLAARGNAFQLVADGRSGILVEPGDPRRLADAIRALLFDHERARGLGRAARESFSEHSSPAAYARDLAEVHATALGVTVGAPA